MVATIVRNLASEKFTVDANVIYKEAVRKKINEEVKKIIGLQMKKAVLEVMEEYKKATRQVVDDYRSTIHQIVEEEKTEIWKKAAILKKSLLDLRN
jgi:1-aminocyclopropane-1-carboxylate deaminase/D-cysteine desulfhydrase-like pyridoxal-dependent ACC family enzyme